MPQQPKKKSKALLIVLIVVGGGFVAIMILGVLAAIAIPAFVKYVKASKATEATATVKQLSREVQSQYETSCTFPPKLPALSDPAKNCGGTKTTALPAAVKAWTTAGLAPPSGPTYFSYDAEPIDDHTYRIRARADFRCGGPMHTYEIRVSGTKSPNGCTAELSPPILTHEFE